MSNEQKQDLQEAFDLFDKDGGGTISVEELKSIFKCFDIRKTNA